MPEQTADAIAHELGPVLSTLGLDLFDVEVSAGVVRVTVTKAGGVDLEALTAANKAASATLDLLDPIPGHYTLEVSSPGVERRLRTATQFAGALGETVSVRLVEGEMRRLQGVVSSVDDDAVVVDGPEGPTRITYGSIERARTVFEWGGNPPPGGGRGNKGKERVHTS
jgi:ribosome maturation factor RimP